jgi:hypothetical protein
MENRDPVRIGTSQPSTGEWLASRDRDTEWQAYVQCHPGPTLGGAALVGLVAGCWIAGGFSRNDPTRSGGSSSTRMSASALVPEPLKAAGSDLLPAARASWQRLTSRVEGLVNRVIDEVADATERALVPSLVSHVETLLEGRDRPRARNPF